MKERGQSDEIRFAIAFIRHLERVQLEHKSKAETDAGRDACQNAANCLNLAAYEIERAANGNPTSSYMSIANERPCGETAWETKIVHQLAEELVQANNDRGRTYDNSPSVEETEAIIWRNISSRATKSSGATSGEIAAVLADLFAGKPIACVVNGEDGKAAFMSADSKLAYATQIIEKYRSALPSPPTAEEKN